jgi:TPR repeat protein
MSSEYVAAAATAPDYSQTPDEEVDAVFDRIRRGVTADRDHLLSLAAGSCLMAKAYLSTLYYQGNHLFKKDRAKASQLGAEVIDFLNVQAERENRFALNILGLFYDFGICVTKDEQRAVELYSRSVALGHPAAMNNLGISKEQGCGCAIDLGEAYRLYLRAAEESRYPAAYYNLGDCYNNGRGVLEDRARAREYYQLAADNGHAPAWIRLGDYFRDGILCEKSMEECLRCYNKAADMGSSNAQNHLGDMYYFGKGVTKNEQTAFGYFKRAADQGHISAMYNVAHCYENGKGVSKNLTNAVLWYTSAANDGHGPSQNSLGYMYYMGHGVTKSDANATKYFLMSAEQGYAKGLVNVGNCYKNGRGFPQDYAKALHYYRMAAARKHPSAYFNIGNCYDTGSGVPKNWYEARKNYKIAADLGYDGATAKLKTIYGSMLFDRAFLLGLAGDALALTRLKDAAKSSAVASAYVCMLMMEDGAIAEELGAEYRRDVRELSSQLMEQFAKGDFKCADPLGYFILRGVSGLPLSGAEGFREAVHMLEISAKCGQATGKLHLGYCYHHGIGVPVDEARAVELYRGAADEGFAWAQNIMGDCLHKGVGGKRDDVEAFERFKAAADEGLDVATANLGFCYRNGIGVLQNNSAAFDLYRKAAANRYPVAMALLSECYEKGIGTAIDLGEAASIREKLRSMGFDATSLVSSEDPAAADAASSLLVTGGIESAGVDLEADKTSASEGSSADSVPQDVS